jgi:preprotein translocase subunit SecE
VKVNNKQHAVGPKALSPTGVPSWFAVAVDFLKGVHVEFDKVHWPTKKETMALSGAVFFITLFFTFFLGLVDALLSRLVTYLMG